MRRPRTLNRGPGDCCRVRACAVVRVRVRWCVCVPWLMRRSTPLRLADLSGGSKAQKAFTGGSSPNVAVPHALDYFSASLGITSHSCPHVRARGMCGMCTCAVCVCVSCVLCDHLTMVGCQRSDWALASPTAWSCTAACSPAPTDRAPSTLRPAPPSRFSFSPVPPPPSPCPMTHHYTYAVCRVVRVVCVSCFQRCLLWRSSRCTCCCRCSRSTPTR